LAVVVATGSRTYFGHMAKTISGQPVETSFDKGIKRFTWLMIQFIELEKGWSLGRLESLVAEGLHVFKSYRLSGTFGCLPTDLSRGEAFAQIVDAVWAFGEVALGFFHCRAFHNKEWLLALLDRPKTQNAERWLNPPALRLRKKMCFL
jgi:hypothetical protein